MKNLSIINIALLTTLFLCFNQPATAQTVAENETTAVSATPTGAQPRTEADARIRQLETEVEKMRTELEALKKLVTRQNQETAPIAAENSSTPATPSVAVKTVPPTAASENKTSAAQQQKPPLGVDIGSARLTPYGTIYFNAFGNSSGTNNTDIPLFATPTGGGNFSASVRQTRLGLKLEGARVGSARLSAILEADFYGGFPSIQIGDNFGVMRVRLANARLDWEKTSVVAGQDWMVFAPVSPTSLAAAAIPQMAAAGNNWARLPQVRIERKLGSKFIWQGAMLAPQTGDFVTNTPFLLQPTSGAGARLPFFQSRLAFAETNFFGAKKTGTIGLSGHYGRARVLTGAAANVRNDIESVGVALDWNVPLAERLSLSGEAFFGRNLGGFQGGVFQSYNNDFAYRSGATLVPGGVRAIGTRGGWLQLGVTPDILENRLGLYASIGVDDPRDADLVSRTPRDFRRRNLAYAFDAIYKFTPQFQVGAEFRRFQTHYLLSGARSANHVNLSAAYSF